MTSFTQMVSCHTYCSSTCFIHLNICLGSLSLAGPTALPHSCYLLCSSNCCSAGHPSLSDHTHCLQFSTLSNNAVVNGFVCTSGKRPSLSLGQLSVGGTAINYNSSNKNSIPPRLHQFTPSPVINDSVYSLPSLYHHWTVLVFQ